MLTTKAVWVCGGKGGGFVAEAKRSARSFKNQHKETPLVLITSNKPVKNKEVFDEVIYFNENYNEPMYLNFVRAYITTLDMADRILLFDTDTYTCAPLLPGILKLLSKFDFLGVHSPGRRTTGSIYEGELRTEFAEVNVGFLAYNTTKSVRELFNRWLSLYEENTKLYKNNDQGPLRDALWEWDGRMYMMPEEYHFRYGFGGSVQGKVRLIHGRNSGLPLYAIAKYINDPKAVHNSGEKVLQIRGYTRYDFNKSVIQKYIK